MYAADAGGSGGTSKVKRTGKGSAGIPALVSRRLSTLSYLKRCVSGDAYWLNVVRLNGRDVERAVGGAEELAGRTSQWFYLGYSLGKLLDLPRGSIVARAAVQLLAEYGHHVQRTEKRRREPKNATEEVLTTANLSAAVLEDNLNLPVKAELRREGRRVVYDYFEVPPRSVGVDLCYSQVVVSLLDTLIVLYHRFGDESCMQHAVADAIYRIDKQFMDVVVARLCADMSFTAGPVLKRELKGFVDSLYADAHLDENGNFVSIRAQTRRECVVVGTLAHSSASSLIFGDDEEFEDDEDDEEEDEDGNNEAAALSARDDGSLAGSPDSPAAAKVPDDVQGDDAAAAADDAVEAPPPLVARSRPDEGVF